MQQDPRKILKFHPLFEQEIKDPLKAILEEMNAQEAMESGSETIGYYNELFLGGNNNAPKSL